MLRKRAILHPHPAPPPGSNSTTITNNGAGSCPAPGSGPSGTPGSVTPGSLANVPTAAWGVPIASTFGTCFTSGAFYIGLICAESVLVGVRMVGVRANTANQN